jgi:hypothetical protein
MKTSRMTDAEIREAGWEALIEKLGPAGALRFAIQTERGSGDYAEMRDRLLGSASVDELVSRMRGEKRPYARKKKVAARGARRRPGTAA